MKTIIIRAQFECLVQKDGQTLGLIESEEQQLKVAGGSSFVLTFFPLNNFESLPYSCKMSVEEGEVLVSAKCCAVIKLPCECYEVVFFPYLIKPLERMVEVSKVVSSQYSNFDVRIEREGGAQNVRQTLEIYEKGSRVFNYKLGSVVENCEITSRFIGDAFVIVVSGSVEDYEYALFVVANGGKIEETLELLCHKIEVRQSDIKTLTKCFDINKHGKVNVYSVEKSKFTKKDEYLVNIRENVKVVPAVVPFAFFESLKLGDVKLARSYLSDSLNGGIDDAHLKAYFGDFVDIRQNNINDSKAVILIYKNGNNFCGKLCKITMAGDKIDNFDLFD